MINNFEQINELLTFESSDDFYFLQIIQRRKDIPDLNENNICLMTYYISNKDLFKRIFENEIIPICKIFNARAYINLNKRSFEKVSFKALIELSQHIYDKNFIDSKNIFNSICGKYHNASIKKWIIDIDIEANSSIIESYYNFIENLQPIGPKKIATIPTKNGVHLICTPFDLQTFKRDFPSIDVHKNNPTLLFTY